MIVDSLIDAIDNELDSLTPHRKGFLRVMSIRKSNRDLGVEELAAHITFGIVLFGMFCDDLFRLILGKVQGDRVIVFSPDSELMVT